MSTDLILENAHPALIEHVIEEAVFQACLENGEDAINAFATYASALLQEREVSDTFETELSEAFQPYFESVLPFYEGLVDLSEAEAAAEAGSTPILQRLRDKGSALNKMVSNAGGVAKDKAAGFAEKLKAGAKRLGSAIGRGVQKARKFMGNKMHSFGGKLVKAGVAANGNPSAARRGLGKLGFAMKRVGSKQAMAAHKKLGK